MGLVLREQKKNKEARQAFERAAELGPDSVPVLRQLVELDLENKNYPAAQQRVQKAIERNPTIAALTFLQARVHLAQGETNAAEAALQQSIALDPNFRDAYLALAQFYIGTQKPRQALEKLEGILARNPKDMVALLEMAMLMEIQADYAGAKDAYEKLLAVSPQFSPALNNLAYLYAVRLKQPVKGFELAQKGRRLLPNDPTIADTLGWTIYLCGDYAGALPLFQESAEKLLDQPEIQYHLGMAHYMMGNEEPARAALQRAVQGGKEFVGKDDAKQKLLNLRADTGKPVPEIVQSLEKASAQSPNDVVLLQRLGSLYEQGGRMEKARDVAEKVLKINPKAVRPMLLLARVYGAQTDGGQRALEYAKRARAAAPDDAQTIYAAGCAAFQAGQHEWAYGILQESSRKLASNPDAWYEFAWAAYSVGRVAEAESAMQAALHTGTNFSKAGSARQFLQFASSASNPAMISQATPKIEEALRADSGYVPALFAAALVREQSGNYPEAKKLYEQVLERYPRFVPATRNLAILYADHLDDARAGFSLATEARRTLPEDVELAKALGKLAYWRGEYQYAAQLLKEALQQKGADAEAYYYLGMSQHRLKQKADSAASLHQALALNLDAKQATEAERVLAELK
jgi:tetratricopeptide (TPR) repeat protein